MPTDDVRADAAEARARRAVLAAETDPETTTGAAVSDETTSGVRRDTPRPENGAESVVRQAARVMSGGADPCEGALSDAQALADAGLLIPDDWSQRAERVEHYVADLQARLEGQRDEARARVADLEADNARLTDALRAARVEVAATRRRLLKSVEGPHVTNIMDAFCERLDQSLSGTRERRDATPSDTTDTLTIDPKRLTWDQRIPTAHEFGTWVESLPAGEFATGLQSTIADALREREKGQTNE